MYEVAFQVQVENIMTRLIEICRELDNYRVLGELQDYSKIELGTLKKVT